MKEFHEEGDSPVKRLVADAEIQFLSCGEPRLMKQLMLFCDDDSVRNINYEKETKRARVISEVDEVGINNTSTSITSIMAASIGTNNDSLGTNGFDSLFMLSELADEAIGTSPEVFRV